MGGTEIKSLRLGKASISQSFCEFNDKGELFVVNMHIDEYSHGGHYNHMPKAERKLLLNKRELKKLRKEVAATGLEIVDNSITDSGGKLYGTHKVIFDFRDKKYVSENIEGVRVYTRISELDSTKIVDVKHGNDFTRHINDSLVKVKDSMAVVYSNSINSVHYFVRLPYGLNDAAVNKELLGTETIADKEYYKVKVTFDQQGGGDDFEDTYLYWFDMESFKPEYLARPPLLYNWPISKISEPSCLGL